MQHSNEQKVSKMYFKNHFSIKKKILIKMFKSKWSSRKCGQEEKLFCKAHHDFPRTMHYKETFNAYKEK